MHAIARAIETPPKPRHGTVTMDPYDIIAAIKKAGSSQKKIADAVNRSPTTVNHVIFGRASSRRIADEISRVTKIPVSKLWPGRYDDKK